MMSSKMLKSILKKELIRIRVLFVAMMHRYVQLQVVHRSTKNINIEKSIINDTEHQL